MSPVLILQLIALLLFLGAAIYNPEPAWRVSLGWLGAFFAMLSIMVH